jgi:hypothetical protein
MGTNYYTKIDKCQTCGHKPEGVHLGKSSYGWKFMFQANGERYYSNVPEMKEWLKDKKIEDEYGEEISQDKFWEMVEEKQKCKTESECDCNIVNGYKFFNREFS